MAINPISCEVQGLSKRCGYPAFGSETPANAPADTKPADLNKKKKSDEFLKKLENMPPAAVGLSSALVWFGIGIGLDRLVGVIFKSMKTSMKSSLIWNGIFGAVMGGLAYWNARKDN